MLAGGYVDPKLSSETEMNLIGPPPVFRLDIAPSSPSSLSTAITFIVENAPDSIPFSEVAKLPIKGVQAFLQHQEDKSNYGFLCMVGEELEILKQRVDSITTVIRGEEFGALLYKYLQVAKRITSKQKRELLRNAFLNRVTSTKVDSDLEDSFLDLLDSITPRQIHYLKLGQEPIPKDRVGPFTAHNVVADYEHLMGNLHAWKDFLPEYPDLPDPSELTYWIKPLIDRGLLIKHPIGKVITSKLGNDFLGFIAKPI